MPVQRYGEQAPPAPVLFCGRMEQVPFAEPPAANEQTSQAPSQAVSQQKPSTQFPEAHWRAELHTFPFVRPGVQTPPEQNAPAVHWLSVVHDEGQPVLVPLQT